MSKFYLTKSGKNVIWLMFSKYSTLIGWVTGGTGNNSRERNRANNHDRVTHLCRVEVF